MIDGKSQRKVANARHVDFKVILKLTRRFISQYFYVPRNISCSVNRSANIIVRYHRKTSHETILIHDEIFKIRHRAMKITVYLHVNSETAISV